MRSGLSSRCRTIILPGVLAPEKKEGVTARRALDHGFLVFIGRLQPAADLGDEFRIAVQVIGDDEPCINTRLPMMLRMLPGPGAGVSRLLRDHRRPRSCEQVREPEHGIEDRAAHVLEVDVDALQARVPERLSSCRSGS